MFIKKLFSTCILCDYLVYFNTQNRKFIIDVQSVLEMRKVIHTRGRFAPFCAEGRRSVREQPRHREGRLTAAALLEQLADSPVIASVKSDQGLRQALESDASVIFLLYGDVLEIGALTRLVRRAGKTAFVHLDLVDGLAAREVAVDFIARDTEADGIISTKPQLVRRGHELGLVAVQRFFLLDSMAMQNMEKHLGQDASDLIEVLPGVMPKVIRRLADLTKKPIIAGGLISDKEDVVSALSAGAVAVSVTKPEIWGV